MHTAQERQEFSARIRAYEDTILWRYRADDFRRSHGPACDACGGTPYPGTPANDVHHLSYARAFEGTEPDSDLRLLCRTDHERVHTLTRQANYTLPEATEIVIQAGRQHQRRQHPTTPTPHYAYDPRTWDTYAKEQGLTPHYPRPTPRRRRKHRPIKGQRALAWTLAATIWGFILFETIPWPWH